MNFSWLAALILICLFSNCATTPPSPIEKQVHSPNQKSIQESTVSSKELIKNQDVMESVKSISGLENMEGAEKQVSEVLTDPDNIDLEEDFEAGTGNAPVDQQGEMDDDKNESTPLLVTHKTTSSVEQLKQSIKKNADENWQESNAGRKEMDGNISDDLDTKPDITDLVITAKPQLDEKEDSIEINSREGNGSNDEFSRVVRNENNASKLGSYFDPQRSLQLKKINFNPGQEKESNTNTIRTNKLSISTLEPGSFKEPNPVILNKIGLKVDLDSSSDDIPISKKNVNFSLPAEFDSVDQSELNNKQMVNFDFVQPSLLNEESVRGNSRVGFQGQKDRQDLELESTKFQVGLREQTENPILRNQTTNDRRMIEPNYSPKTYGHLRTFLDRTKKTQEPRAGGVHSQFERTQNYLNRESNTTSKGGVNRRNDLLGKRYEKTQEWIKNRGRSQTELILE